jgi:FMN-dependent NADH-azoreductase
LREVLDNSTDEVGSGYGNIVHVSNNINGYNYVADDGRGIPIRMSIDVPTKTEADLAISELHSSGKFRTADIGRVGMNGVGEACVVAVSERFALLVKVTENNWKGSIPDVEKVWKNIGPRQKNELYYVVVYEKGYKVMEYIRVTKENLEKEHITPLTVEQLHKRDNALENGDFSDPYFRYAKQFAEADIIVMAVPYWDLSFPALVKIYFEATSVCGITFRYTPEGYPQGLCKAKKFYYVTTSGGFIGDLDFGFQYAKALTTKLYGIPDVECIRKEGLDIVAAK